MLINVFSLHIKPFYHTLVVHMKEGDGGLLSLVPGLVKQLRDKYEKERAEISFEVSQHLADMRRGQYRALDEQSQLRDMLSGLLDRLESMETASMGDGSDMHSFHSRMAAVERGLRDAAEEQQLLKAALFHDRVVRNDRYQRQTLANEQIALRMKQAEDTLDVLRSHLHQWRTINTSVMEHAEIMYRFVDDNHLGGQDSILKVQRQLLDELREMREDHERLAAKVSTVKAHLDSVDTESAILYKRLEDTVDTIGASRGTSTGLVDSPTTSRIRSNLERFYRQYQPAKLASIPSIIREYEGAEAELYAALEIQYSALGFFSN